VDRFFLHGTADNVEDITPRMRRIRITDTLTPPTANSATR
jgi:hypothetical protein